MSDRNSPIRLRVAAFCERLGLDMPILLAPMAGACPPPLSIAVANAGAMGGCGCLLMQPDQIAAWIAEFRAASNRALQLNLWTPDPPPVRDPSAEAAQRAFLETWGPPIPPTAADAAPPDFDAQCAAVLEAAPRVLSSIMGVFPPAFAAELKRRNIAWFATATTVAEALAAQAAGADAIVAQGAEAGGHRGAFKAGAAERQLVGLFALLPQIVDAVSVPVIAAGGIGDGRGAAAALVLGASAVEIGSALLRCPEANISPAWARALRETMPEATMPTRAFSGRLGRAIATDYVRAAAALQAPKAAPYPVQRALTAPMRTAAAASGDLQRMQAWAGQAARLGRDEPAADAVRRIWSEAQQLI